MSENQPINFDNTGLVEAKQMNEEDVIDDNDINKSPFTSNAGIISNKRKTEK